MISKLKKYIKGYKRYAFITPIAMILEVALEVYIPFVMAEVINVGAAGGDKSYILKAGLLMALLAICSLICGALAGWSSSMAGTGLAKNVRKGLFDKITDFSFANIDKFNTSSLITRLTVDVNNMQMAFMMIIRTFVRSPFMLISATIMAFKINSKVAIVFLISVPVLAIALGTISVKAYPKFQRMLKKYDVMNRNIQENLVGIRAVKAFVREDNEIDKFSNAAMSVRDAQVAAERILALNGPIMQTIVGITIASVLFFGGKEIINLGMEPGDLMTLVTYGTQILMSLMMLSMIIVMMVLSRASITRIMEVLDEEIDLKEKDDAKEKDLKVKNGNIEFKNVSFKYNSISKLEGIDEELEEKESISRIKNKKIDLNKEDDNKKVTKKIIEKVKTKDGVKNKEVCTENHVLSDINLKIKSGETIGIIGGTGSSKSTLVSLIPRLYDANCGKVLVGDVDVKEYTLENLRNSVAMVLQKNELFSGTIKENLRWGNENATDEEIIEVCKVANAHDFISSFTNGYETILGQNGVNVSGGQKQRLTIARALLKSPKILILDDSMSAVDTKTDASIRKNLKEIKKDVTKIIIAQRVSSIMDSDKILVLDDGRISGYGTHDDLLKTNDIYKEIYNSQKNGGR